ncbi:zinc knuckle CX2CX4HX4C containing protein [Tanacetum coccineum]
MEQGFLNRSTKPKTKKKDIGDSSSKVAPLLTDLAKKVRNIEGKMVGNDGKPLKPYRHVKPVENPFVVEDTYRAKDGVAGQDVDASNLNVLNDALPTSCVGINNPDVISVSKTNEGTVATSGTIVTSVLGGTTRDTSSQAIQRKIVKVATLMNEEKVQGAHVALPLAAVNEISAKFDRTLYGYFIGSWLAFPIVKNYVRNAWAKYGLESTIVRDGFFLFKFSSNEGLIKVLDKGSWFIRSRPLMLHTWSANTKMKKEECKDSDASTSEMCLNPWGPKTYARVLVELSAEVALMDSVIVVVPFPNGTGHSLENLAVEYEWRPSRCSKCNMFGHDDAFCPSKDNRAASNSLTGNGSSSKLGSEGGKQPSKSKSIHGIRFSKPKAKFVYRPVSKDSQGEAKTTHPNHEGTNSTGDQSSESLVAAMENIPSDNGKSKFIQDDINLGNLRNTMDKLMEEDKVLDINTDDIGNKTLTDNIECSNMSQTVQADAKKQENGSLWERFKEVKMASTTDSDSEVEEVYSHDYHKSNYIALASG